VLTCATTSHKYDRLTKTGKIDRASILVVTNVTRVTEMKVVYFYYTNNLPELDQSNSPQLSGKNVISMTFSANVQISLQPTNVKLCVIYH
jgi:hypothetical protein